MFFKPSKSLNSQEMSWILYDWANSAFILIVTTTFLPIFFKDIVAVGLNPVLATAKWGTTNSLVSLGIALLAPFLGTLSDYPGYKKRLWATCLTVGVCFTFSLTFVGAGMVELCLILYFFAKLGYSGSLIFYDAFLVDVTPPERRDELSASGYAWGYVGSLIPFGIILGLFQNAQSLDLPSPRLFSLAFMLTGLWWFGFSLPFLLKVKQKVSVIPQGNPIKYTLITLRQSLEKIKTQFSIWFFLLAYFFYIDGVDTLILMAIPYGRDVGIEGLALLKVVLVVQILGFPFTLLYGKLAKTWGAKPLIFLALGVYLTTVILGFFLPVIPRHTQKMAYWFIAFLIGSSQGGIQALSRSFLTTLIPPERAGEYFGFYNIFGKFAVILGPFMVGYIGKVTGHTRWGILSLALNFILGAFLLSRVKDA